jgi:hypothetical protein
MCAGLRYVKYRDSQSAVVRRSRGFGDPGIPVMSEGLELILE